VIFKLSKQLAFVFKAFKQNGLAQFILFKLNFFAKLSILVSLLDYSIVVFIKSLFNCLFYFEILKLVFNFIKEY